MISIRLGKFEQALSKHLSRNRDSRQDDTQRNNGDRPTKVTFSIKQEIVLILILVLLTHPPPVPLPAVTRTEAIVAMLPFKLVPCSINHPLISSFTLSRSSLLCRRRRSSFSTNSVLLIFRYVVTPSALDLPPNPRRCPTRRRRGRRSGLCHRFPIDGIVLTRWERHDVAEQRQRFRVVFRRLKDNIIQRSSVQSHEGQRGRQVRVR